MNWFKKFFVKHKEDYCFYYHIHKINQKDYIKFIACNNDKLHKQNHNYFEDYKIILFTYQH